VKYATEVVSCDRIYIPSFMTVSEDVQAVLMFCFNNSRGFNIGITDW
jgi:hypothetical protein